MDPKYDALLNGPLPEETKQQKLAPQIEAASKAAGAYLRARYAFDASTTPTQWSQRLAPVTTPAHLKELRKLARDVGAIPGSPGSDAPGKGEPTRAPGSGSGGGGGRWSFTVSVAGAELSQWFGFTSTSMTIAATYTQQYLLDGVRRGDAEPEAVFVAMRFSGGRWVASRLTQNAPTG